MGKENKDVKKKNKNKVNYQTSEQQEIIKFLIVVLVVIICVGGIYFVTRAFVTKDLFDKKAEEVETVTPGTVNYDVTTMGQMLSRPYDEYYVAIYNSENKEYRGYMRGIVGNYSSKEKSLHIYTVDLSNIVNDGYYDPENVNLEAKTLEELKVGDATLIKVKKNKKTGERKIETIIVDLSKMKKELGLEEKTEEEK